jgi:hypothetical protein
MSPPIVLCYSIEYVYLEPDLFSAQYIHTPKPTTSPVPTTAPCSNNSTTL